MKNCRNMSTASPQKSRCMSYLEWREGKKERRVREGGRRGRERERKGIEGRREGGEDEGGGAYQRSS